MGILTILLFIRDFARILLSFVGKTAELDASNDKYELPLKGELKIMT